MTVDETRRGALTPFRQVRERVVSARVGPWTVTVLLLCALLAGGAWALASPLGASPDDDFHQASIWCPSPLNTSGCQLVVDSDGAIKGAYVPQPVALSVCYALNKDISGSCLRDLSDEQLVPKEHINQGAYPGGYYRFMHLFVTSNVTLSVIMMRMVNVLLAVGLLASGIWLLPAAARQGQSAAILSGLVPLGMFLIASVNPSSWAVSGVVAVWLGVHALLQARERWRIRAAATLTIVGGIVGASARADSGAFLVVVVGLTAVLHWRTVGSWWRRIPILVVPPLLGVWSYVASSQRSAISESWAPLQARDRMVVLFKDLQELPSLVMGVFGQTWGLGWLDTPMPAVVGSSALFVAGGLVMVGLSRMNGLKGLVTAALMMTIMAVALLGLLASNYYVGEGIQPRYLLPLIVVLLAMMMTGRELHSPIHLAQAQTTMIGLALAGANGLALFTNMRRYITGLDVVSPYLNRHVEWWWSFGLPPTQVFLIGSAAFAVLAFTPWLLTRPRPQAPEPAPIRQKPA